MRLFGGVAPAEWLVVGLGNPGRRYERTPHNVGFEVARALIERWGLGSSRKKFNGWLADGRAATTSSAPPRPGPQVAVLLPETYMNESGRSVGPARGALKVDLDHVVVVHDEIDLPFGDVRARVGGGLAGHNGLKSLRAGLGSADFRRVRVGVGRPDTTDSELVAAYVLGPWTQSDAEVAELVDRACAAVEAVVLGEHI